MTTKKTLGRFERQRVCIHELFDMFPDEQSAREWFESVRWKNGRFCPLCGCVDTTHVKSEKPLPYRCRGCREHFSVKSGTIMHRSKIPLKKWAIAICFMSTCLNGISNTKLYRDLKISQKSAWKMLHKIRQGWDRGKTKLSGEIEVDEKYIGDKESNKRQSKKLKQGLSAVRKDAVVRIEERDGQTHANQVHSISAETLHDENKETIEGGAVLYRDEHKALAGIGANSIHDHQTVKHSVGELVKGMAHTKGIESYCALVKRGHHGTYHKMSSKHLHRHVSEFMGRHNFRGLDTRHQLERWIIKVESKRVLYNALISY